MVFDVADAEIGKGDPGVLVARLDAMAVFIAEPGSCDQTTGFSAHIKVPTHLMHLFNFLVLN